MIAELVLGLTLSATTAPARPSLARRWQIEAAGWERLALECGAELGSARGRARQLQAQLQGAEERAAPAPSPAPPRWRTALLGGAAGAAVAGGTAAGVACAGAECRWTGVSAGVLALGVALALLISQ